MLHETTRRRFAVLVALLVTCSFVGAPVGAAAATSNDGLSGTFTDTESSSGSGDETQEPDDEESNEEDEDSGGNDEADTTDGPYTERSDDNESSDETTDNQSTREVVNSTSEVVNSTSEVVNSTTDAVDSSTDAVDSSTDAVDSTETIEWTLSPTGTGLDTSLETVLVGFDVDTMPHDDLRTTRFESADTMDSDTVADRWSETRIEDNPGTTVGSGDGQPSPSAPAGGAAIGLGVVAAAVAVRSSPAATGVGAGWRALGSAVRPSLSSPFDRVPPFLLPLRYSRYDDSDPLEHDARERVYEIVSETPGSYLSAVADEADLPLSTTRHHIKVLEREELVSGAKLRGKRRFYPAYTEGVELDAALSDESTASIIDAVARLGAASVSDLADDLDRDPSTISHHLQRLEEDDIITREREGRAVMNKLAAEVRSALKPGSTPKPEEPREAVVSGAD